MKTASVKGTAVQVVSEVMEQFAFLFPLQVEKDDIVIPRGDSVEATICFSGPHEGHLTLLLPEELCIEIAANALGIEKHDAEARKCGADSACELLNLICGQFLTTQYGEDKVFDLAPPTVDSADKKEWNTMLQNPDSIAFSMMEGSFLLQVSIER